MSSKRSPVQLQAEGQGKLRMLEEEEEPEEEDGKVMGVKEIRANLQALQMDQTNEKGDIAQQILERVDQDGDGRISTEEWEVATRNNLKSGGRWDEVSKAMAALDISIGQFKDVIRYAFTNFDENGDGQICFEEFCLACRTLGVNLSVKQYQRIFDVLAQGGEFIMPEEPDANQWQSFGQGFDTALKAQYRSKGFARAQYVLEEVCGQWEREAHLPFQERVSRSFDTFWSQAENLSDLAEFLLDLVGVGIALGSISDELKCLPDCDDQELDVANLIPLVFLLRKSLSDVLKEVSDQYVQDMDQDTAMAFATVFKPAGVKLTAFMKIRGRGAEWRQIPQGQVVPYSTNVSNLQLIVRGSMNVVAQGNMAGLRETVAILKAGSFIGGAQFIGAEDGLISGRGSDSSLVANEDVLVLEWNAQKLKGFLQVYDSLRTQFTSVIVRSIAANMSQVTKQSKKFAKELPLIFRNFTTGLASSFKADRATIWIHSAKKDSLWTWFVSETGKTTYVSIPSSTGLVGVAFSKKAPLNIPDCYQDDRFNAEVDKKTGYYTQSMLCVPVLDEPSSARDREGNRKVIGVVQLINKMSDSSPDRFCSFVEADERRAFDTRWTLRFMMKQLSSRDGIQDNAGA